MGGRLKTRSRIGTIATALLAALTAVAVAAAPAGAAKAKVKVLDKGQKEILKGGLAVKVKAKSPGKVKLQAESKTFDEPKFKRFAKPEKVNVGGGSEKVSLALTKPAQAKSCEARTIEVSAGRFETRFEHKRDTGRCKPRKVDLSRAGACDFIAEPDPELCMLPFPDDYYMRSGGGSRGFKGSESTIDFSDKGMPRNASGVPISAAPYSRNDGFSPGQTTVVNVPGLEAPDFPFPALDFPEMYKDRAAPVIVIDTQTGERWPVWAERDANSPTPERSALLIHPLVNYASGHRYVVAIRGLEDADGEALDAPEGFRYYRDDLPSEKKQINSQRKRFEKVFKALRKADVDRADLYLAWDFTVSTDENIAERMLHIRDDAFAQLGDTNLADVQVQGNSPGFTVTSVENFPPAQDPEMARRVQGTYEVPCYLQPNCEPGGTFQLGPNGLPSQNGTYTANFNCMVPRGAIDAPGATPGRAVLYGHGLLGSANEATSNPQQVIGSAHNLVDCGTSTIGFSNGDIPNVAGNILPNLSNFPQLTDRVQQGLLNSLFLGRLMIHQNGFVSHPAFHVNDADASSPPVLDTSRLYYNGNSQGGILGGALTAVAPDHTRASLGVPAMNYSVLLNRSIDFDTYKLILDPAYPDPMTQQLALSMIQMLWDRSDPNGYAHRMTDDPLPNTPPHEVLLNVAFGDHQVTNWQADVEARTIGASIHNPVVYGLRWGSVDAAWNIPRIQSYPFPDSAIVYWDSGPTRANPAPPPDVIGTDPPPLANVPNRSGADPHGLPRVAPPEMQMVSDFLRPNAQSAISDTCLGGPCYAGGFTGP